MVSLGTHLVKNIESHSRNNESQLKKKSEIENAWVFMWPYSYKQTWQTTKLCITAVTLKLKYSSSISKQNKGSKAKRNMHPSTTKFLHFPSRSYLFYIGCRGLFSVNFHPRLRLNFSTACLCSLWWFYWRCKTSFPILPKFCCSVWRVVYPRSTIMWKYMTLCLR